MVGDEIRQIIRDQIKPGLVDYGRNLVFISRIMGSNWRILSWGMKVAGRWSPLFQTSICLIGGKPSHSGY